MRDPETIQQVWDWQRETAPEETVRLARLVSLLRNDLKEAICFELDNIAERINETLEEEPESISELVLVDSIQLTNELEWEVNLSIDGSPLTIYVDYETTSYEGIEEVALEICLKLLGTIKMEAAAYD